MLPGRDLAGVPDSAQWPLAVFPARLPRFCFHGGRLPAALPGRRMPDARAACCIMTGVLAVPLFRSFPGEEKSRWERKGISMTDGTGVAAESVLLPSGARCWAGSLASVAASGLAAGTWFRGPGVAGSGCSAVMRARVVSITLRGLRAATGARCRRGRLLTRSARWRR